ncbi:hypothetical protein BDA99DRAFT_559222 [Phascolomyces articulosus]|uniref:Transmembrane protein n=1 Tax=Phascolomyces articulosus TaxID=60185 RepID=A0AAD5PGM8_9FUNG|nr:hypothetical protein BDA99DRAFT_559222 [Phascolomyces articulosus]
MSPQINKPIRRSSAISLDTFTYNNTEVSTSIQLRRRSFTLGHGVNNVSNNNTEQQCTAPHNKQHYIDTIQSSQKKDEEYLSISQETDSNISSNLSTIPSINNRNRRRSSMIHGTMDRLEGYRRSSQLPTQHEEETDTQQTSQYDDELRRNIHGSQIYNVNALTPTSLEEPSYSEQLQPTVSHPRHLQRSELPSIHRSSTLASRPPSYKAYATSEQNIQREQEWGALVRLQKLYQHERRLERGGTWFKTLLWNSSGEEVENGPFRWRDVFAACVHEQFQGFHMTFWIVFLVFVGAISVFLPNLSNATFALWIPLIVYVLIAIFMLRQRRKRKEKIQKLECQVVHAREHRIQELVRAVELPENHYFVTEHSRIGHTHPVTTLLPPPPTYQRNETEASPPNLAPRNSDINNGINLENDTCQRDHTEEIAEAEEQQQRMFAEQCQSNQSR